MAELRHHIAPPQPLQWDWRLLRDYSEDDHFTFYASIAHLCVDPMIVGSFSSRSMAMYSALVEATRRSRAPAAGRYDFATTVTGQYGRHGRLDAGLRPGAPPVEFAANNDGTPPHFRCRSAIYRCPIPESCYRNADD